MLAHDMIHCSPFKMEFLSTKVNDLFNRKFIMADTVLEKNYSVTKTARENIRMRTAHLLGMNMSKNDFSTTAMELRENGFRDTGRMSKSPGTRK